VKQLAAEKLVTMQSVVAQAVMPGT